MSPVPDVYPDSKFHGANMGPTWILSTRRWAPCWPHEPCYLGRLCRIHRCWSSTKKWRKEFGDLLKKDRIRTSTHTYILTQFIHDIYLCMLFFNVWHIDKSYIYCFTHIDAHATHILNKIYFANTTITPSPPPHLLKWCHSQRQVHPMMIINFWRWASLDYTNFRWLFLFMLSGPASRTYRMYTCAAFKNHACPYVPSLKDTKNNSIFSLCQRSVDTLVL